MPLTIAQLAKAKGLDEAKLREPLLGLRDEHYGVAIPYWTGDAREPAIIKRRTSVRARDGSWWPQGLPVMAYGSWLLQHRREIKQLVLVEGESDVWALLEIDVPALGIPGANNTQVLGQEHLSGVELIYIWREPDQGGDKFVAGCLERLFDLGFRGEAREIRGPEGVKDPCSFLVCSRSGRGFAFDFAHCLERAGRLCLPSPQMSDAEIYRMLNTLKSRPEVARKVAALLATSTREAETR